MGSRPQWRGQSDTLRWRLRALVLASALLHLPLSPIGSLLGLVALLEAPGEGGVEDLNAITAIPVDLEGEGAAAGPASEPPAPPPAEPDERMLDDLDELADEQTAPVQQPDAGVPDAGQEPADAQARDADAAPEAGPEQADAGGDGAASGVPDPGIVAGPAAKVAVANAHVRVFIFMERIRNHPEAARVRELLEHTWQWQDFFGPAGIDPVDDIDRIFLAGPQLRNSSEVGAVVQHNAPPKKMRGALDRLVRRDPVGGRWLDAGVPAAEATADRAGRVFAMPNSRVVLVLPQTPSGRAQALKMPPSTHIPPAKGREVVYVHLDTPWRAVRGLRFKVPKSVKWARIELSETVGGGAVARVEAEDASAEDAKRTAAQMERGLRGFVTLQFIERVSFHAQDTKIYGKVEGTKNQVAFLLELALQQQKRWAKEAAKRRAEAEKARRAAPADAGRELARPDAGVVPDAG